MRKLLTLAFAVFSIGLWAQETADSLALEKEADTLHSVRKATLLSTFIPGAGQIYNHKAKPKGKKNAYWKVPLFLGALGYMGYSVYSNQASVFELRNEYRLRETGVVGNNQWQVYDDQGILQLENAYAGSRDRAILGFALAYAFQVADAAVEAHFVNFDVSEDLSLKFTPVASPYSFGLAMQLNFR
jgi:hypothetical protein